MCVDLADDPLTRQPDDERMPNPLREDKAADDEDDDDDELDDASKSIDLSARKRKRARRDPIGAGASRHSGHR